MVAINDNSMPSSKTDRCRTRPMVANLYQGMSLDSVTGLHDKRARDYSLSLGRSMEQDPLGYINGGNTYQMQLGSPAAATDPSGQGEVSDGGGWCEGIVEKDTASGGPPTGAPRGGGLEVSHCERCKNTLKFNLTVYSGPKLDFRFLGQTGRLMRVCELARTPFRTGLGAGAWRHSHRLRPSTERTFRWP